MQKKLATKISLEYIALLSGKTVSVDIFELYKNYGLKSTSVLKMIYLKPKSSLHSNDWIGNGIDSFGL